MDTPFSFFVLFLGAIAEGYAILSERRMHEHRQPGVTYGQATFRVIEVDGRWQNGTLFTPEGLRHQKRASFSAVTGFLLWGVAATLWLAGM